MTPTYRELSRRVDAPPGSSWGLFGPADQLGTLNFLTEEATAAADLGVQLLAEKAIAGRGVLLDAVRYHESTGDPLTPRTLTRFTPDALDRIAAHCGVEVRPGDIVLLRTGFAENWLELPPEERGGGGSGLDQSDEMLAWLWDHRIALMASDNGGLESFPVNPASGWVDPDEPPPPRGPSHNGMLHRPLLALLGMVIGELWKLDELAADCAADGVHEFMVTVKPLNLVGGVGSPPNAMAIK